MTIIVLLTILGAVVIAAVIYIGLVIGQKYSNLQVIGTDTPCVVMFVGDSYIISAYLLHSPSGSSDFKTVSGSIEFFRIGDCFILPGATIPGIVRVSTELLPQDQFLVADGVHQQWSLQGAQQTVNGIAVGEGEIQISGESAGDVYKEIGVPVTVVANDGQTTIIDLFRIASEKAGEIWSHGILGNFLANFFKGQSKGLCDHWADWTARWFNQHNNGDICKIEKVWFGENNWWRVNHVCVRITSTCETREVFYVDGHQDPDNPIFGKDDYEGQIKRGAPSNSVVVFSHSH